MENSRFDESNGGTSRKSAPAIAKAVRVLEVVAHEDAGVGISAIARRSGLSKSTVHGLVGALIEGGLLMAIDGGKGYRLGARLFALANRARERHLIDIVQPAIAAAAAATAETSLFGRLSGDRIVILAKHDSSHPLNLSASLGSSLPLLAGALGRAYLASCGDTVATSFLQKHVLPRYTDRSITEQNMYAAEVRRSKEKGYATDRGEYLAGIIAAATAFSWLGGTYFVWAVGVEAAREAGDLEKIGVAVRNAAADILGALESGPHEAMRSA